MNEIIGLHKEKVISLSSNDHGRCFMAAAFHGETKLLNLLKESFCNSSENNIGKKWLATTTAKVILDSRNKKLTIGVPIGAISRCVKWTHIII